MAGAEQSAKMFAYASAKLWQHRRRRNYTRAHRRPLTMPTHYDYMFVVHIVRLPPRSPPLRLSPSPRLPNLVHLRCMKYMHVGVYLAAMFCLHAERTKIKFQDEHVRTHSKNAGEKFVSALSTWTLPPTTGAGGKVQRIAIDWRVERTGSKWGLMARYAHMVLVVIAVVDSSSVQ